MALNVHNFQPGAVLHASVIGVLHSRGITFQDMCRQLDLRMDQARAATLGLSQGATGKKYLAQILEFAGMAEVAALAVNRLERDLAELKRELAA